MNLRISYNLRWVNKIAILVSIIGIFFFIGSSRLLAHPLDEVGNVQVYDQKQILTFDKTKVHLTIDLTFYPIEKIKVWESIDVNKDQKLSSDEKEIWMRKGQEASWIEFKGEKIYFHASKLIFPDYYDFFGEKIGNVSIEFESDTAPGLGAIIYTYEGKDKKLEELTFEVKGTDGLSVNSIEKQSSGSVSFVLDKGDQVEGTVLGLTTNNRLNSFLDTYVKADNVPMGLLIFSFLVSFFLGALHALTPGHGKAIVASYLVGSKGTLWHALNLGLIVTITHTASVFLLGLAAVVLTEYVVAETVVRTLNTASGILVLCFGLYLVVKRAHALNSNLKNESHHHEHRDHDEHNHALSHELEISWKNLLPLGISGGIVPCVDALAILIVAISLQKTALGLMLLVFFSLGLATALCVIGGFAVLAKDRFKKKFSHAFDYEKYISLVSAIIVTLLGVGILMNFGI